MNRRSEQSNSSHVQSSSMADPFVENRPSRLVPLGTLAETQRGVNSVAPSSVTSAGGDHSEEHKKLAAFLAAQIKSGLHEEPDSRSRTSNRRHRNSVHRGGGAPFTAGSIHGRGEWQLQKPVQLPVQPLQPVVRQTLITPDIVPNPPFFEELAEGIRPKADEAFDYIPFTEVYKNSKPSKIGVIKIRNVCVNSIMSSPLMQLTCY